MTFTASDVSSLSASLARWELAEYCSAILVTIACAGEYVADFTKWFTGGIKERKERLAKASTLLLIVSLSVELVCLVKTNSLSGMLIGYLSERAERADTKARSAIEKSSIAEDKANAAEQTSNQAIEKSGKADASASSAINLARGAGEEADSVHQEIGRATDQLSQLTTEAQKTKSDLINLALCNAPRVISNWFLGGPAGAKSYADPLRPMAGQIVFIEVVPDAEARRAALNIAQTLLDAKWNVQKPLTFVDGLADGVSVQPSQPTFTKGEIPNMSPYWHASDVAEKLLDFLHSYNWQAVRGWPTDPQGKLISDEKILPAGAIRIQVGLYPAAVYVSPPGQKELTSRMEEIRREREKARAESKRKREEQWATFPPELRKRLQEADDEWEAKIKSVTSNGPCQVLNPPF